MSNKDRLNQVLRKFDITVCANHQSRVTYNVMEHVGQGPRHGGWEEGHA